MLICFPPSDCSRVNAALRQQADRLWHTTATYLHPAVHVYAQRLAATMPPGSQLSVVYPVNSGSEANDLAMLLARVHTGHFDVVSLRNGYHGMSPYTMGLAANAAYQFALPGSRSGVQHVRESHNNRAARVRLAGIDFRAIILVFIYRPSIRIRFAVAGAAPTVAIRCSKRADRAIADRRCWSAAAAAATTASITVPPKTNTCTSWTSCSRTRWPASVRPCSWSPFRAWAVWCSIRVAMCGARRNWCERAAA